MSKQVIYDTVKAHLLTQNAKSVRYDINGNVKNAYRENTSTPKKCAIGCLILDPLYVIDIEGKNVDDPAVLTLLRNSSIINDAEMIMDDMAHFLRQLQDIHDTIATDKWSTVLDEFARFNGLNP